MNLAVIPARGGSRRIPGKNIKRFAGKPIIAYSIDAAIATGLFQRIIVSTDSEEIAAVALEHGAETPFIRPSGLADDFTPTADVLLHALAYLAEQHTTVAFLCCLYATAPLVQPRFIRKGYELIKEYDATSVFSVTTYPASIHRALQLETDGRLAMVWPENELARSNDLAECYHDAAQFYWLNAAGFQKERRIYSSDARPVVLPRYLVQDIDTPEDWLTAEAMYYALRLLGKIEKG